MYVYFYFVPLNLTKALHDVTTVTFDRGKESLFFFFFLASQPLWFLETSITEVARGACASKSSMQDALPSDWLPGGRQEVTLKCMCGGARCTERKTELDKEKERGEKKEEQLKDERGQASKREAKCEQGRSKNNENSAPFRHNVQVLICRSVVSTQNAGRDWLFSTSYLYICFHSLLSVTFFLCYDVVYITY